MEYQSTHASLSTGHMCLPFAFSFALRCVLRRSLSLRCGDYDGAFLQLSVFHDGDVLRRGLRRAVAGCVARSHLFDALSYFTRLYSADSQMTDC